VSELLSCEGLDAYPRTDAPTTAKSGPTPSIGKSLIDPQVDTSILISHSLVTDVHLVNLAACRDMTLATFDRRLPTHLAPRDRHHVTVIPAGVAQ